MKLSYYTETQKDYLRKNYRKVKYKDIANRFNRTPRAIQKLVARLGLAKNESKNREVTI